jgi:hypothetical protein
MGRVEVGVNYAAVRSRRRKIVPAASVTEAASLGRQRQLSVNGGLLV